MLYISNIFAACICVLVCYLYFLYFYIVLVSFIGVVVVCLSLTDACMYVFSLFCRGLRVFVPVCVLCCLRVFLCVLGGVDGVLFICFICSFFYDVLYMLTA